MWQFKKLPPRTGSRGGEIRVPGSSPRYSTDDLLPERLSSPGLVRRLLLVFPLSSRDYLALHLSAALLDYRPSRSTQFRMTRPPLSLSLSYRFLVVGRSYFFVRVMMHERRPVHRSIDLRVVIFTLVCSAETMFRRGWGRIIEFSAGLFPLEYLYI